MGRYAVEIPVADWEIFFAIPQWPWINFHHHLTSIKGCKEILELVQQF